MKRLLRNSLRKLGYDLVRYPGSLEAPPDNGLDGLQDLSAAEIEIITTVRPYTMTSPARLASLLNAVNHLVTNRIEGDIAECGVWRGGSMMAVALALLARQDTGRTLYLYDTYEGMSPPTSDDVAEDGSTAASQMANTPERTGIWCYASLEDVRANIISTGYPKERIRLVKGKVEDTIPGTLPGHLALLRLDTDWYESTKHELTHLFPLLDDRGVLIIDDYGHWRGAKKAVDEYFAVRNPGLFLHRVDYTARMMVRG